MIRSAALLNPGYPKSQLRFLLFIKVCMVQNTASKTVTCRIAVALNLSPVWGLHWSFIGLHVVNLPVTLIPRHPSPGPNEVVPSTFGSSRITGMKPDRTTEQGCRRRPSQRCSRTVNHPSTLQKDSQDLTLYIWITYALHNCFAPLTGTETKDIDIVKRK